MFSLRAKNKCRARLATLVQKVAAALNMHDRLVHVDSFARNTQGRLLVAGISDVDCCILLGGRLG